MKSDRTVITILALAFVLAVLLGYAGSSLHAQGAERYLCVEAGKVTSLATPCPAPALTDAQKLEWQKALTRLVTEQARRAQAEADYLKALRAIEVAQKDASTLLQTFAVPGFTLDPETLLYTKNPEAAKAQEKKEPPKR